MLESDSTVKYHLSVDAVYLLNYTMQIYPSISIVNLKI